MNKSTAKKDRDKTKDQDQLPRLLITPEAQRGVYSNQTSIHHSKDEFIVDHFLQFGKEPGLLVSRIILSPSHMKKFKKALDNNVKKYEEKFGSSNEE